MFVYVRWKFDHFDAQLLPSRPKEIGWFNLALLVAFIDLEEILGINGGK